MIMHTDMVSFTCGDKSNACGAEVVALGDAAKIDSGNIVATMAKYLAAVSLQLCSPNGTVTVCLRDVCPSGHPVTPSKNPCEGIDYSVCTKLDYHRS